MPAEFPEVRDGDVIEPRHLNIIYAELRRWRKLKGDNLVVVSRADSATSPPMISWGLGSLLYPAKVGGSAIPAISGTTPGSGTVTLQEFDGTDFVDGQDSIPALNWSSAAIAAGTRVWLAWFSGAWFINAVDC